MDKYLNKIVDLWVYDTHISSLIEWWVEKLNFSVFWSDYKTFNQNIDKTKSYLDNWVSNNIVEKLSKSTSLSTIMLFVDNSSLFNERFGRSFEELYVHIVRNNIKLSDDSKVNRLFFKSLSRLSFYNINSKKYIYPNLTYNEKFLESLNDKLDLIADEIKSDGKTNNPEQWNKSNIVAWIWNIWIEDEWIKTYLSLLWKEQDNMYEQKLWFFISYLLKKLHPLNMILEESYLNKIKSLYDNSVNEEKNDNLSINNNSNMEKLTSQESLLLMSLLTKPFSILYWVSWTWKSRVVKELWKKLYWDSFYNFFHKESVPPNWFDESEIVWRYNEIERYKEWSFVRKLEEAIKDPSNNYVYLLDEMNLSHIEQYLAQYLSSVEEINNSWGWVNVWECNIYHTKRNRYYSETINFNLNDTETIKDIVVLNNDYKSKPSFLSATFIIDGEKVIESSKNVWDFYYQFISFIIDNYNESLNLFSKFDELEDYENIKVTKNNVFKYEDKKYILYNGYYFENNVKLLDRLNYISSIVDKVNSNYRENINFSFWVKNNDIPELYYFYDKEDNIIWKSLRIPKNFFVVWTINLDETTKSISPKVVDRANIIEFNDLDNFLFIEDNNKYDLEFLNNLDINKFNFDELIELRNIISNTNSEEDLELLVELDKKTKKLLNRFYQFLKVFKLHFSYRTLKEVIIFIAIWKKIWLNEDQLFDLAIMQKILPKLNWVIDYSFKLYAVKEQKLLSYDISWSDNQLLSWFEGIDNWVISWENVYKNTSLKLRRMQHFFDTYQNVNYFLS